MRHLFANYPLDSLFWVCYDLNVDGCLRLQHANEMKCLFNAVDAQTGVFLFLVIHGYVYISVQNRVIRGSTWVKQDVINRAIRV